MSIRTGLRHGLVAGIAIVLIAGRQVAADIDEPHGVCVRGARTFTCADGSTIDACDDCSSGSSGGGGNGGGGGLFKAVGMLVVVAIFVPGFVISPGFALESYFGLFDQHIFGDRDAAIKAARERWERDLAERQDTARRGRAIAAANLEIDHDEVIRDALNAGFSTKHALQPPPPGKFWWTKMPHLQPNLDIACKAAGIEYPFHMFPSDPIGIFASDLDMLGQCAGRYETPVPSVDADPAGRCTVATATRCMHVKTNGRGACCPQGHPIFNAADEQCYRDTDYRGASTPVPPNTLDDARRFLGGEYCPAYSP